MRSETYFYCLTTMNFVDRCWKLSTVVHEWTERQTDVHEQQNLPVVHEWTEQQTYVHEHKLLPVVHEWTEQTDVHEHKFCQLFTDGLNDKQMFMNRKWLNECNRKECCKGSIIIYIQQLKM